jgi:hypothetical protein
MEQRLIKNQPGGKTGPATGEPAETPGLIRKKALARALSVSPRCIEHWQRSRKIPCIRLSARLVLYDLQAVLKALKRFETMEVQ